MTNYVWDMSPNSGTITWVNGSNQVMIFWSSPGSHWVSVSYTGPGGCTPAEPTVFDVTVNPLPDPAGTITGTATLCAGTNGVAYSIPAVANAVSYAWTLPSGANIASGANTRSITVNFSPTAVSGTITVHAVNACGDGTSSSFAVTVNPLPATPVITQNGNLLTSSAVTGNQWYFNGAIIPGATSQTYVVVYIGNYYTKVTLNGCSSDTSNNLYVVSVIGMNEFVKVQKVEVYPNPNNGHFTLLIMTSAKEAFDLRVLNNLGISIYEHKNLVVDGTLNEVIDLKNIPNGVYSVILNNQNKQIVRKIVVE